MKYRLAAAALVFALAHPAPGQVEIKTRKGELEGIKEKLDLTRVELALLEKKEASILARLEMLDQERGLIHQLIDALQLQENDYRASLEHVNLEISAAEIAINKKKHDLKSRLLRIYRQSRFHELEIYLSTRSIPEVLAAAHYLRYIAVDDRRAFDDFKKLHRTYTYQKGNYETTLAQLFATEQEKERELAALKEQNRRETALLDSVRSERKEQRDIEKELKQAQRRLEEMIVALERARKIETGKIHPLEVIKGEIPWPCRGKVINTFGKIRHPKYNTVTKNNGIDIRAAVGSEVFTIGSGKISYADRFLGYGNMVMVDHGDGYYTIYGHLSEVLVTVGEAVKVGQKIGKIGDIGSLGESMLHFELRKKGKPVDPLVYLK